MTVRNIKAIAAKNKTKNVPEIKSFDFNNYCKDIYYNLMEYYSKNKFEITFISKDAEKDIIELIKNRTQHLNSLNFILIQHDYDYNYLFTEQELNAIKFMLEHKKPLSLEEAFRMQKLKYFL